MTSAGTLNAQHRSVRDMLRDPDLKPDWGLVIVVLLALGVAVAVAVGFGDEAAILYASLSALISIAVGLAAGPRAGIVMGGVIALLLAVATVASATPLTAAAAFLAVILWLTIPNRLSPSPAIAPLLQLAYFIIAAFGTGSIGVIRVLSFSVAGAGLGLLIVLAVTAVRSLTPGSDTEQHDTPSEAEQAPKSAAPSTPALSRERLAGYVLGALVSAGLLYWRVSADSQTAAWVLLTFIAVFQPTYPVATLKSLGRVAGTLVGFAVVIAMFAFLPEDVATTLGIAAIVPSMAYTRRDYVVSVAATTILVVTIYGAPAGQYLSWGIERTVDTAIGASIAVIVSAIVRRLEATGDENTNTESQVAG